MWLMGVPCPLGGTPVDADRGVVVSGTAAGEVAVGEADAGAAADVARARVGVEVAAGAAGAVAAGRFSRPIDVCT